MIWVGGFVDVHDRVEPIATVGQAQDVRVVAGEPCITFVADDEGVLDAVRGPDALVLSQLAFRVTLTQLVAERVGEEMDMRVGQSERGHHQDRPSSGMVYL
ncbi:hypothetical protein PWY87_31665 [Kribbella solani]|uniref:hypothetical protein n=1 Tax=Kribbella solani TaxID=236067 RepID=UPI0029A5BF9F|nr:hypothetical protein [Kribbella solani]MDX3006277.1 hypothetical protein [Kribbella solani]